MLNLKNLFLIAALTLARTAMGDENATAEQPPATPALQLQLDALQHELAEQRREFGTTRQALSEQRQRLDAQALELEAQKATIDSSLPDVPQAHESIVRFYGFADMGLQKLSMDNDNLLRTIAPTTATTFVMGNINLYVDAQPSPDWQFFTEIRFTNLPNGADSVGTVGQPYSLTSTRVLDATSSSGGLTQVKYGSIVIERAYVAWQRYRTFNVRVGAILTPFGIWNVDHGSPTLISLMLPQFEAAEMFPTHQVGIELRGSQRWSFTELGYHLYVTNGRTPGEVSLSEDNKLIGGRIFATWTRPVRLTIGASGFLARERQGERIVTSVEPLTIKDKIDVAYDERAGGVDLSLDWQRLRLRSEFTARHVNYEPYKRALVWGEPGLYDPDHTDWDYYVLGAYRLPWWGLEPYAYFEIYDFRTPVSDGFLTSSVGLNIHFTAAAQLKFQFADSRAFRNVDTLTLLKGPQSWNEVVALRLVLAF